MKERFRVGVSGWRATFLLFLVGACSQDDTGSGSSKFHSRVDEAKALGALSPAEQKTLCEDVASWTTTLTKDPAYIAGFCNLSAISTASLAAGQQHFTVDQLREACRTAESQCMSQQTQAMPMTSSRGCAYPTACAATVGELRDCTVGTYEGNMNLYATLPSCDAMQPDTVTKIDYSIETSAASVCAKVTACGPPS